MADPTRDDRELAADVVNAWSDSAPARLDLLRRAPGLAYLLDTCRELVFPALIPWLRAVHYWEPEEIRRYLTDVLARMNLDHWGINAYIEHQKAVIEQATRPMRARVWIDSDGAITLDEPKPAEEAGRG